HWVLGDLTRLHQIVWNLVKNAIKFTPAGGKVILKTRRQKPGRLMIEVSDSGIGIEPGMLETIFKPFEQASMPGYRPAGLGLGLSCCRPLAEAPRGTVPASSEGPGRGSRFTLALPAADAPGARSRVPAVETEHRKLRILLVEDHVDTARVMAQLLRSVGHEV